MPRAVAILHRSRDEFHFFGSGKAAVAPAQVLVKIPA